MREVLFTFVSNPAVAPTNNEAERTLRDPALARRVGRTNKTPRGARRQTIIKSVLESIRTQLPKFTLKRRTGRDRKLEDSRRKLLHEAIECTRPHSRRDFGPGQTLPKQRQATSGSIGCCLTISDDKRPRRIRIELEFDLSSLTRLQYSILNHCTIDSYGRKGQIIHGQIQDQLETGLSGPSRLSFSLFQSFQKKLPMS